MNAKRECPHCKQSLSNYEDPLAVEMLETASRRVYKLESDLRAARAELEAATGRAEKAEDEMTKILDDYNRDFSKPMLDKLRAELAAAKSDLFWLNCGTDKPGECNHEGTHICTICELEALRRQIDGAATVTASWSGGYPEYDGLPEIEPDQDVTFKLLEVKP